MQKVVHLIFTLESGGSENMLVDIANEQAKRAKVSIILINNKFSTALVNRISKQVRFHALNREEGNKRSPGFLIRLWKLLMTIKPDVIHCHNHKIIQLLPWHRNKAVFTAHSMDLPTVHLKKYREVYAISEAVAANLGIPATVVSNGIDFSKWQPRTVVGPNDRPLRMVQVSRLVHEIKGQDLLLQALKQLKQTDITLDLIGAGPSMAHLKTLTSSLGLQDEVRFLGEQSREYLYERLPQYDILVQPSRMEGFGLTVVEGIAAGLPVIASKLAGPAEILEGIPAGFTFNPGDVDDLVQTLNGTIQLIRKGQLVGKCTASRMLMKMRYDIEDTAVHYLRCY